MSALGPGGPTLPIRGRLPVGVGSSRQALRLWVGAGSGERCVVLRSGDGVLELGDGGDGSEPMVELPTRLAPEDLWAWLVDPDRLLGDLVPWTDLVGEAVLLVSHFEGLVASVVWPFEPL